jgi:uncharacterized protein YodC (DUF2158 family)
MTFKVGDIVTMKGQPESMTVVQVQTMRGGKQGIVCGYFSTAREYRETAPIDSEALDLARLQKK